MSLSQLWKILRAQVWSIVLMTLVSAAVAYSFAQSLPKQYTAKARVLLDLGGNDPIQYAVIAPKTEDDYIGTQARLVTDIGVGRQVVEQLGMTSDPAVIAAWQAESGGAGDVASWAASRIMGNVGVRRFEDSAILEIYYSSGSVDSAKQIVGLLRTAFIDNSQRLSVVGIQRGAVWNRTQAAKALVALNRAEAERVAFLQANRIALNGRVGDDLRAVQQLGASTMKAQLRPAGPPQPSPLMERMRLALSRLDADIAVLEANGPNSPVTLQARTRREQLRGQLARETAFVAAGSNATSAAIAENAKLLTEDYLRARLAVLEHGPLYDKLAQIDREIRLRTSLYLSMEAQATNLEMIAALPSGVRVVGDVIADDEPSFPNVELATGLAAALGFALGIALALLGEMIARRVRGAEDLSFYSRVPVLAVIRGSRPRRGWRRSRLAAIQ